MYLEKGFTQKAAEVFENKARLYRLVLKTLMPQFEWEWHLWGVFIRYIPVEETPDQEMERKQKGKPRSFHKVTPPIPLRTNRCGCVSRKFRQAQIKTARAIVLSETSFEKFLERLTKEVEIL